MITVIITYKRQTLMTCITHMTEVTTEHTEKWTSYEVLFETFRDNSLYQQLFFPLFVARLYLFYFMIAYLENNLLTQIVIIAVLNMV